jgi:hypothetical protein
MARVSFEVPSDQKSALVEQAKSLGVSLATYARNLVLDGAKRNGRAQQSEVLRAVRALVLAIGDAVFRAQRYPPDLIQQAVQAILERYEKERSKP